MRPAIAAGGSWMISFFPIALTTDPAQHSVTTCAPNFASSQLGQRNMVVYTVCQKMLCDFMHDMVCMCNYKVAFANKGSTHTRRKSRKKNIAVVPLRTFCVYMPMVIVTTGFAFFPGHRVQGRAFPDFVFRVHRYSSHVFK